MLLEKIATAISRVASVEDSLLKSFLLSFKSDYETAGGEWLIENRGEEYDVSLKKVTKTSIIFSLENTADENDIQNYEVSLSVKKI